MKLKQSLSYDSHLYFYVYSMFAKLNTNHPHSSHNFNYSRIHSNEQNGKKWMKFHEQTLSSSTKAQNAQRIEFILVLTDKQNSCFYRSMIWFNKIAIVFDYFFQFGIIFGLCVPDRNACDLNFNWKIIFNLFCVWWKENSLNQSAFLPPRIEQKTSDFGFGNAKHRKHECTAAEIISKYICVNSMKSYETRELCWATENERKEHKWRLMNHVETVNLNKTEAQRRVLGLKLLFIVLFNYMNRGHFVC